MRRHEIHNYYGSVWSSSVVEIGNHVTVISGQVGFHECVGMKYTTIMGPFGLGSVTEIGNHVYRNFWTE